MTVFPFLENSVLKEIGNVLSFVAVGAIGYFIPRATDKIKGFMKQRFFSISLKRSMEIKLKLAEVKARLKATRIYLYQFHNGKVFLGDHSFHKYSLSAIFEVVSQGLSREIQNMQSMPLSRYAELLNEFIDSKQDVMVIGDHRGVDMSFEEADLEDIKYTMDPVTIAFIKVNDKRGEFIGLISIHFDMEVIKSKLLVEIEESPDLNSLLVDIKHRL
jgi:hypothetical protein